jgi:hypothetical protein
MKLYIIGNGFDIYHGINSRYSDFKDYVEDIDNDLFESLDKYFNTDELWSDFEETLAFIDTDTITDDAENYLVSYGADDWSDAFHHDYQFEIQRAIDTVTVQLKEHFTNWILQLQIPDIQRLHLDKNAMFLTFNYTGTLEEIYGVDPGNVFYIHNKANDADSTLILGHSRMPSANQTFSRNNNEDTDVRVAEGNEILDRYFEDTYKNTESIIQENQDYFAQLDNVDEIFVLGHSISPVDIRYFQEIKHRVREDAIWKISYYGEVQREDKRDKIIALGVNENQIQMITLNDLQI